MLFLQNFNSIFSLVIITWYFRVSENKVKVSKEN